MSQSEDRDTLPPPPAEAEAMTFAGQLFGQLDRIEKMMAAFFTELGEQRAAREKLEQDVAWLIQLEKRRHNGNGHAVYTTEDV